MVKLIIYQNGFDQAPRDIKQAKSSKSHDVHKYDARKHIDKQKTKTAEKQHTRVDRANPSNYQIVLYAR